MDSQLAEARLRSGHDRRARDGADDGDESGSTRARASAHDHRAEHPRRHSRVAVLVCARDLLGDVERFLGDSNAGTACRRSAANCRRPSAHMTDG